MSKRRMCRHDVVQPEDQSIRLIPLTRGQNAIVDAADYDWLMQWNWTASGPQKNFTFYAYRISHGVHISMHRLIANCAKGLDVDHINHNTLDNRRANLRQCTHSNNLANSSKQSTNSSGYKGVHIIYSGIHRRVRWHAQISICNRNKSIGLFDTKEEAARAYDKAATEAFGEFAHLNFPDPT